MTYIDSSRSFVSPLFVMTSDRGCASAGRAVADAPRKPVATSAAFRSIGVPIDMSAVATTLTVPSDQLATKSFAPVGEMAMPVGSEPVAALVAETAGVPCRPVIFTTF